MLWRNADFSCQAARRGAPTTARGRVRCAVAIFTVQAVKVVQFGQGSCPAGEYLQLKNKKIKLINIENNCDMLCSVCLS